MAYRRIAIDPRGDAPPEATGEQQGRLFEVRSGKMLVIATANDEVNITEPSSPYHPVSPFNDVTKHLSGHVREFDNTPGAERIFEQHKSGTFYEIHPDGSKVVKVFGKDFHIVLSDNNLVVGGNLNITVQGDANLLVAGNLRQKVGGNMETIVHGNYVRRVRGQTLEYSEGDMMVQTAAEYHQRSGGTSTFLAEGDMNIKASSIYNQSDGEYHLVVSGAVQFQGSTFDWNGGGANEPELTSLDEDADPSGGLEVPTSLVYPSFNLQMFKKTPVDLQVIHNEEASLVFPQDRVPVEESNVPLPEPLVS